MPEDIIAHLPIRLDSVAAWTSTSTFVSFEHERSGRVEANTKNENATKAKSPILTPALRDSIAFEIGAVPEVLAVFASVQDRVCYVWTIVNASDQEIRKRIYGKEKVLIGRFGQLDFEFNVMPSCGQNPKALIPDSTANLTFLRD